MAASSVGLWRRFVALVVDTAAVGLISWPLSALYGDAQGAALWALVTWLGYYAAMEWLFGATLGKLYVGLRVVSAGGKRAPWSRIAGRNLFRVIDVLPFAHLVGGLSVLRTAREQRVGDRGAGTVVVPVQEAPPLKHLRRRVAALAFLVVVVVGGSLAYDY